jgi:hypothetical protein
VVVDTKRIPYEKVASSFLNSFKAMTEVQTLVNKKYRYVCEKYEYSVFSGQKSIMQIDVYALLFL